MRRGGPAGPLHGVPVGVKDIYNTSDMKTTSGSPCTPTSSPDFDSTAVALLRRSGAIVMGKTVTTEFACADPSPTRNPWIAAHTPGGSQQRLGGRRRGEDVPRRPGIADGGLGRETRVLQRRRWA